MPHDRQHLVLQDLTDVQIVADGVEMICTETTRALTVSHCTNMTVRGLVIDYDPLPFAQGRITGFDDGRKVALVELFDGYPDANAARNFKFEIFRSDTRTLRCSDRYVKAIEVVDARHLRILMPDEWPDAPEQTGDLIVIGAEYAPHGNAAHAVVCEHDVRVRLENIDLFAANCFGFLEVACVGNIYERCRIDRRAAADDLVSRADPRLRSLDADAFHSTGASIGPAYLGCVARLMGDDCVNIHGDYDLVMGVQGQMLRVLAKYQMNIQPGDSVELTTYDGQRLPDARVLRVVRDGTITAQERAYLGRQSMDAGFKAAQGGTLTQAYAVTLDRKVSLPMGSVICAANRIGNGFAVRGCTFGFNRSRGILIKASHGQVDHNLIEGARMSAILVTPEYWWLEAGSSSEATISGNTIRDRGGIPICVEATGGNGAISPAGAHHDITITGNTITDCAAPGIVVTSTTGSRLAGNTLNLTGRNGDLPDILRQAGLTNAQPVVRIRCEP